VRVLDQVLGMGSARTDSPEDRRRNRLLVVFALAVLASVPPWAGVYYTFGESVAAIFPLVSVPLTLANLAAFARTHNFERARQIESLIILTLPLGVHTALGGFQLSSGVVLWSVLAPFCALVFGGIRAGIRWLVAFAAVVVLAALVQPREANGLPAWIVTAFFAANIATISGVAFALLAGYARQLAMERARSERLLLNVLPAPIATRLREREEVIADAYGEATMIFADVVNSNPHRGQLDGRRRRAAAAP